MLRRALGVGSLAIVLGALSACATEPDPNPAWTEEEAYAAAEETFRAYIGIADPTDYGAARQYVTGDLAARYDERTGGPGPEIETRGEAVVLTFDADGFRMVGDEATVTAVACVDDSAFEVNIDGEGWHAPRDDAVYAVEMEFSSTGGTMLIARLDESRDEEC